MVAFEEALALDIGEKRIGVARASRAARLPEPLITLANNEKTLDELAALISEQGSDVLVVGMPRSLEGDETAQTRAIKAFANTLESLHKPIHFQDEAVTSRRAEELIRQNVYRKNANGDAVTVDEVAACLILDDFLGENA